METLNESLFSYKSEINETRDISYDASFSDIYPDKTGYFENVSKYTVNPQVKHDKSLYYNKDNCCDRCSLWWFHKTTPNIPDVPIISDSTLSILPTHWIWCECVGLSRNYFSSDIECCCVRCLRFNSTPLSSVIER